MMHCFMYYIYACDDSSLIFSTVEGGDDKIMNLSNIIGQSF